VPRGPEGRSGFTSDKGRPLRAFGIESGLAESIPTSVTSGYDSLGRAVVPTHHKKRADPGNLAEPRAESSSERA
jgi:hypothetical protein